MYCTTFPCHLCCKAIISGGLKEVFYIEPYPKSRSKYFYEDMIVDKPDNKEIEKNKVIFNSLLDTIRSCVKDDIKMNSLTSFDVEYMFLQIRSKSVGETAKVGVSCTKCQHLNEIEIKLDDIKIDIPDIDKIINLDDNIKLEVDWPSFNDLIRGLKDNCRGWTRV